MHGAYAHNRMQCGWGSNLMDFMDTSEVIDALADDARTDTVVPIHTPDSHSFQHCLDGVLKIIQVLTFLRVRGNKLMLQKPRDKGIKRMLAKMQLDDKVIWVERSEVVTSCLQIKRCITLPLHPLLWKAMRKNWESVTLFLRMLQSL